MAKEENSIPASSHLPTLAESLPAALNASLASTQTSDTDEYNQPLTLSLVRILFSALLNPHQPFRPDASLDPDNLSHPSTSTVLSDIKALNSLTSSPSLNRFILDVLEGQIVTFLVVIAFILVFLIREWVVQQQPIINAAAQLRDAEIQVAVVDRPPQPLHDAHHEQDPPQNEHPVQTPDQIERETPPLQDLPGDMAVAELAADPVDPSLRDSADTPELVPHADGDAHTEPVHQARRPVLPPRHSSTRVNDIIMAGEESGAEGTPPSPEPRHARIADENGSGSSHNWQHVEHAPAELIAELAADQSGATLAPDQADSSGAAMRDVDHLRENNTLLDDPASGDTQQSEEAAVLDHVPVNFIQRTFNWFWGDITPDAEDDGIDPPDLLADMVEGPAAALLPMEDGDVPPVPVDEDHVQDPEVLQPVVDAGLDVEALDEVEDLEGILELIGMQGPLVGLLQTAMFCGVLITTTLWAALGVPYLCGKLALLFLGDPLVFLLLAPVKIASLISDAAVDSTIYIGGLVTYIAANAMSLLQARIVQATSLEMELGTFDFLSVYARNAIKAASGRLSDAFTGEGSYLLSFLMSSLHAHQSLRILQAETTQVIAYVVRSIASTATQLQTATAGEIAHSMLVFLGREMVQVKHYYYSWTQDYLSNTFMTSIRNGTLTFKFNRGPAYLDPALAYWSATDRCLAIFTGYVALAMIGTMYLLRTEPLFTSPGLGQIEKGFTDFLKQAGGVLKVILIISIEMLAFPLYCGMLLDCALLPLFAEASFASRVLFAVDSPFMFAFIHWFIGTCYMFHFALFVSACRRVMRSGVLYFIRDPDDPTFHPVRDVLERTVSTQLRKIAFSALVYGGLVICCLGGVIWGVNGLFRGVFPIRWATPESVLEFPIDFLVYNLLAPVVTKFLLPSQELEGLFKAWLKHCARALRLSHFLFGDRQRDEEGYRAGSFVDTITGKRSHSELISNGRYVRAPASDQVRIPKGDSVFLEVTADNKPIDGRTDHRHGLHGRKNKQFEKVYIPPRFRTRISLFIVGLWLFAAGTGIGITIVPMVFGRFVFSVLAPSMTSFNDLYAFSVGLAILGGAVQLLVRSSSLLMTWRDVVSKLTVTSAMAGAQSYLVRAVKSLYVYGFALVVVPTLFALVLQLYLILPLHTYTSSWSSTRLGLLGGASDMVNSTAGMARSDAATSPHVLVTHSVHILQDSTLGLLYGRVLAQLFMHSRGSRPAAAIRMVTRDGYMNPNAKLATRVFVLPALLLFAMILLLPPVLAKLANRAFFTANLPADALPEVLRVKMYRYSYPVCASQALILWGLRELVRATQRWRSRIKDEAYLIGERLHNFGERRPPEGSKSAARTR